jgi:OOP family OmpA-OmpF porin
MANKILLAAGLLLALMQLSGCATERVTLLPQPDGSPSAVVVQPKTGSPVVLDQPYMVATVSDIQTGLDKTDATAVDQRYKELMDALPARPKSYVMLFELGDKNLTPESEKRVQEMIRDIKEIPAPELVVIGHSDASGDEAFNDELSRQRALTVRNYLKAKGIDITRVTVVGRGNREPVAKARKGGYEPRNRRVEIRLK